MSTHLDRTVTRRRLLRDAATAGAAAAVAASPAAAWAARAPRTGRSVAVLGGGMAGLAAAHELVERGFRVTVFEPVALGGKARSIPFAGTGTGGRKDLPGEHGFRFFPGFYHHVPDTMRRIPFPGNPDGVHDNLEDAPIDVLSFYGGADVALPFGFTSKTPAAFTPQLVAETLVGSLNLGPKIPPQELAYFTSRIAVFLTSCDARRFGEWEHTSWLKFIGAEGRSEAYRHYLAKGLTRALVAAKEQIASARTIGHMAEAFVMNFMNRGNDGAPDRVLGLPTNEAWIDPWVAYLQGRGVTFKLGWRATGLRTHKGRIVAARMTKTVRGRHHHREVDADWFVSAMPAERVVKLLSRDVLRLDPSLETMRDLFEDWMVGIQFFLTRDAPLCEGHMAYMDTQWSVTSINQAQFWRKRRDLARDYGDGTVKDILSADVSDWDTPGLVTGKIAKECTREEIAREVWEQIKKSVNDPGSTKLRDEDLHSWFMDPGVQWSPRLGRNTNATPLLVNTVGSWEKRPHAATRIPNLFLAGDHVRTNIDLATMEGANESGRAAVNALLDASGSTAERVRMFELYRPPEFEPWKAADLARYEAGEKNIFDV